MTSNHSNGGARNGSQQNNPFLQDGANSMNSTNHNSNLYQQLCALAGALNNGSGTNSRPQENAISLNPAVLNQLHNISTTFDPAAVRPAVASDPTDVNALSNLYLNPQFISLLSAALQKGEPQMQQRTNVMSSAVSNPPCAALPFSTPLLLPVPLMVEQQKQQGPVSLGVVDEPQVLRNEEGMDPNAFKLQKLISAASVGQSHLQPANTSFPSQVAMMQLLANAIQQQAQIHRVNNIPSSVTFPRSSSPSINLSSQSQGPMTSSSTVKVASSSDVPCTTPNQRPWLSSVSSEGITPQDLIEGNLAVQNVPQPAAAAASLSPFLSTKHRPPTKPLVLGVDGMASVGMNSHSSKTANVLASSQNLLSQMQTWNLAQLGTFFFLCFPSKNMESHWYLDSLKHFFFFL